jgi:predicted nucleic acid-binding protein
LKIVDSSFLVEAILKRKELLEEDSLLTVDLAIYETANSIWKHQVLLKDVEDGLAYVSILVGLIESGRILLVSPGKELVEKAYSIAARNRRTFHDAVFIALALQLGSELHTFDKGQTQLLAKEARL